MKNLQKSNMVYQQRQHDWQKFKPFVLPSTLYTITMMWMIGLYLLNSEHLLSFLLSIYPPQDKVWPEKYQNNIFII